MIRQYNNLAKYCRESPVRVVHAQQLLREGDMEPSGQTVLPALHPKRNLHWGSERGTAVRRAE